MKYFKDKYEVPLWNWLMIQEKGFDLSYLMKSKKKLTKKRYDKLYETYMSILLSLENIDSEVLAAYTRWKANLIAFEAENIRGGKEVIKDLEKSFRDYLNSLMKFYRQFEVTEYSFNPDYKELFDDMFKDKLQENSYKLALKELKEFEKIRFYVWDEYTIFINKYPVTLPLTIQGFFKNKFILKNTIKIDDLIQLDDYLLNIYQENKLYDKYQYVRYDIFDIGNLQSERIEKRSVFYELEQINRIRGINIDPKRTTLAEYQEIINVGRDQLETKPDGNN